MNMNNFVSLALQDQVLVIVDQSSLCTEDGTSENDNFGSRWTPEQIENLTSIFGIGIACSEESPAQRMNIRQVVIHLETIKNSSLVLNC